MNIDDRRLARVLKSVLPVPRGILREPSAEKKNMQIAIRSLHGPFEITMILGFHVGVRY